MYAFNHYFPQASAAYRRDEQAHIPPRIDVQSRTSSLSRCRTPDESHPGAVRLVHRACAACVEPEVLNVHVWWCTAQPRVRHAASILLRGLRSAHLDMSVDAFDCFDPLL